MHARRYEIYQFDDVVDPAAAVRDGASVEVSVVAAGVDVGRRVVDFLAGIAVAGSATMTRIERGVFSIVPNKPGLPSGLISLPRARPSSDPLSSLLAADPHVTVGRRIQPALAVRRRDRPFWPEHRQP